MNRAGLLSGLALFALAGVCGARIINVPGDYRTIRDGVSAAYSGDTVLVHPGTYTERVLIRNKVITLASLMLTTGDPAYIDSTVLDGNATGTSVVRIWEGADSTLLIGFTIQNGYASYSNGGGIDVYGASPTISHCVVKECRTANSGGGICCENVSAPKINDVIISGNSANFGGGVAVYIYAYPVFHDVIISGNKASGNGGGLYSEYNWPDSILVLDNVTIQGNRAGQFGGGIYLRESGLWLDHCLVAGDSASEGGGIYLNSTRLAEFISVTCAGNRSPKSYDVVISHPGDIHLTNSIFFNADGRPPFSAKDTDFDVAYSDVGGGAEGLNAGGDNNVFWGDGCTGDDPRFRSAHEGDFRLGWRSPAIDSGDPESPSDPDTSRADMGAIPYRHSWSLLYGHIGATLDGRPIRDALVFTSNGAEAFTDANGNWMIMEPLLNEWCAVTATAPRFFSATSESLFVEVYDTLEVNLDLIRPEFSPSAREVTATIPPDSSLQTALTIRNEGDAPLKWRMERKVTGIDVPRWTLLASNSLLELHSQSVSGVVYADDRFYLTYHTGEGNYVAALNRDMGVVNRFQQFGASHYGMRDLAWDGSWLWGSGEETVFGFTAGGVLQRQWPGACRDNRSLAWDPDRSLLWSASVTGSEVIGYDSEGDSMASVHQPGLRVMGMDYWRADPDNCPLYFVHQPDPQDPERSAIVKMNPETGDTIWVAELGNDENGSLTGAFISDDYLPFATVLMSILNSPIGDRLNIYLLNADPTWLAVEPASGEIAPNESQQLTLTFSAAGLDTGVYKADLAFAFPEVLDSALIPVTMTVMRPNGNSDLGLQIADFRLGEAYPNPFNQSSVISYRLSVSGPVSLKLYDVAGRFVQTIVNEEQAAGEHRVVIGGQAGTRASLAFASGVYLLKMTAGREAAVRKVVCVK